MKPRALLLLVTFCDGKLCAWGSSSARLPEDHVIPWLLCQPHSLPCPSHCWGLSINPEAVRQLLPSQTLLARLNIALLKGRMNIQEGGTRKALRNRNSPPWHPAPASF